MSWPAGQDELEALGQTLVADGGGLFGGYEVAFGDLMLSTPAPRIVEALKFLKERQDCPFHQLIDICGVDYPDRPRRFDVVYHLLSLTRNRRVRLKLQTDEDEPVPSVVAVFPNADWYEREAFDMYGITFEGHPDLRRILTDYGFEGFPLRKDFPMTGYVEVRYDDELKRVVYEPVKITEWRNWDFLSPWEGDPRGLPGDEKAEAS
jgi:NADH-quinone oxidoreductase subunit C